MAIFLANYQISYADFRVLIGQVKKQQSQEVLETIRKLCH